MKYIIYPHNGCADHASEARLRSLLQLLNGASVQIYSDAPQEDLKYWPHPLFSLKKTPFQTYSIADKNSVLLAFQGDHPLLFPKSIPRQLQILLGACVPMNFLPDECRPLFAPYETLIAYDHLSLQQLSRIHPNVIYCPDPLLISVPQAFLLPGSLSEKEYIVLSMNSDHVSSQLLFDSAVQLIQHMIDTTNLQIILTPFICQEAVNDLPFLRSLFQIYARSGRVVLLKEMSSKYIHYLCSRARFVITSYPAEALLAYSSAVPALLLTSSPRAMAIASELLGSSRPHILPPDQITDSQTLIRSVRALAMDERRIRRQLQATIPFYQEQTTYFSQALRSIALSSRTRRIANH